MKKKEKWWSLGFFKWITDGTWFFVSKKPSGDQQNLWFSAHWGPTSGVSVWSCAAPERFAWDVQHFAENIRSKLVEPSNFPPKKTMVDKKLDQQISPKNMHVLRFAILSFAGIYWWLETCPSTRRFLASSCGIPVRELSHLLPATGCGTWRTWLRWSPWFFFWGDGQDLMRKLWENCRIPMGPSPQNGI